MSQDGKFWATVWAEAAIVAVVAASCVAITAIRENSQNVSRDKFYAQHCKVVQETVNSNSVTTKVYSCKDK